MKPPPRRVLAKFRVYPGRVGGLYFKVFIWPTKRAMQYWVKWEIHGAGDVSLKGRRGDFAAICCSNTTIRFPGKGKNGRKMPLLGQLHFYPGSLRMGVICHEAGHAALAYCDRMRVDINEKPQKEGCASDGEETFCYALGEIARQIVVRTEKSIYPGT